METVRISAGGSDARHDDLDGSSDRVSNTKSTPDAFECESVAGRSADQCSSTVRTLPTELVIMIFEHAARNSKATAASLSLISRFTRSAVLPLLFRTLVIQNRATVHLLRKFLTSHTGIAYHIRELWMRQSIDMDGSVVLSCPRLERLAITPACFNALFQSDDETLSLMPLTRIHRPGPYELLLFPGYVRWDELILGPNGTSVRSFLHGLTHLWLSQERQVYHLLNSRETIANLSRLTAFADVVETMDVHTIPLVLGALPKLQMFVMIPQHHGDPWMFGNAWPGLYSACTLRKYVGRVNGCL